MKFDARLNERSAGCTQQASRSTPSSFETAFVPHQDEGFQTVGHALSRRAFRKNALQRATVHVEAARGFRDVVVAQLIDALDVFPADAVG